ncbi:MAG: FAD-dependent oxidoreductase [Actinobacteria bacterium]|nr:FAD-dependent oxidoreductase [Actinomycetota bacterium]
MAAVVSEKRILVVGGGITGVSAASQLASAGLQVHLIERGDHLGGQALEFGCKATDTCQQCNVCLALDRFRTISQISNVYTHLSSRLISVSPGPNGSRYQATVFTQPLLIDPAKCIACGLCASICPAKCISPATPALGSSYYAVDRSRCLALNGQDCSKCSEVCPTGAIDFSAGPHSRDLDVDAILLAIGYEPYDALGQGTYGYGSIPNVITGLDAERQLQDSTTLLRPSDSRPPTSVAFIQCVGSRTQETEPSAFSGQYCSAVCCAYAMRISRLLAQKTPGAKVTIFYMDLQNFGKDYQSLYNDCHDRLCLIRSRPSRLSPADNDSVLVTYEDPQQSRVSRRAFDLVVLSIGIRPPADVRRFADMLNIDVDEHGFFDSSACYRPGIFVAGTCTGPTDIAGSIDRATAASARIIADANAPGLRAGGLICRGSQ